MWGRWRGTKGREDDACTCTSGEAWRDGEWSTVYMQVSRDSQVLCLLALYRLVP